MLYFFHNIIDFYEKIDSIDHFQILNINNKKIRMKMVK